MDDLQKRLRGSHQKFLEWKKLMKGRGYRVHGENAYRRVKDKSSPSGYREVRIENFRGKSTSTPGNIATKKRVGKIKTGEIPKKGEVQPRTWEKPYGQKSGKPSSGDPKTWPKRKTKDNGAGKGTGTGTDTSSSKVITNQPSKKPTVTTNTVQNKGKVPRSPMEIAGHGQKLDRRGRPYESIPGYNASTGKIGNRKVGLEGTPFQVNLGEVSPDPGVTFQQAHTKGGLDGITTPGELQQFIDRSPAHSKGILGKKVALKRMELANKAELEGSLLEQQTAYDQNVAMRQNPQIAGTQTQTPIMGMGPLADPTMYGAMLRGNNFIQPTGTQGMGPIASGVGYGHNLTIMKAPTVPIPTPVIPPVPTIAPTLTIGGM